MRGERVRGSGCENGQMAQASLLTVFVVALATALATGLGALPMRFTRSIAVSRLGVANAVAAGVMIAASMGLLYEGVGDGPLRTVAGALAGCVVVHTAHGLVHRYGGHDNMVTMLQRAGGARAFLVVVLMTVHSFPEGVGVGVSFAEQESFGLLVGTAIAIHNIPEGLAIALVMVPTGVSVTRAAAYSIVSSLPQPLMAVPAFLFVAAFLPVLPVGLGFAAGAMLWLTFTVLIPDALQQASRRATAAGVVSALLGMMALQFAFVTTL